MEGRLTIREHALTGGGAGVVHGAAGRDLHAAQAQLVVALVDAGVLHVELGDAARGTQVSSARRRCLVSTSQGGPTLLHTKSCMQPMSRLVVRLALQASLAKGVACCAEAPFMQLPAKLRSTHQH